MKTVVLAVILVGLLSMPALAYDWITSPINGHRYTLTSTPILQPTWVEAEAEAVSLGGHLATIHNETEEQWLKDLFGADWLWIGLNSAENWGTFVWSSGEPVIYTNWNHGEPSYTNSSGGEREYYAGYNISTEGGWNDFPDWYRIHGIIEVVPEPASLLGFCSGIAMLGVFQRRKKNCPDRQASQKSARCLKCGGTLRVDRIADSEGCDHVRGAGTPTAIYSVISCQECGTVNKKTFLTTEWWY